MLYKRVLFVFRRSTLLTKQNYRCAGCGMKVDPGYAKRYRYCEYTGKYFCQCCHSNQTSVIPARMLKKWDFYKYYVSNFAHGFLTKIMNDPLFNISDINPMLYKKVKTLAQIKEWREQLRSLKSLMSLCKLAKRWVNRYEFFARICWNWYWFSMSLKIFNQNILNHFKACSIWKQLQHSFSS